MEQPRGKLTPRADPNMGASYSYRRVGQYTSFAGYEKVRQGNIFFAGEHCSEGTFKACIDPEALAVSLTALIQGGYVLARTFRDEALMRHAEQGALALISELR